MKFALPGFDNLADIIGYSDGAGLGIPGSNWFIAPNLLSYFLKNNLRIYIETLPSVYTRRRFNGIPITIGTLTFTSYPEIAIMPKSFIKEIKNKNYFDFVADFPVIASIKDRMKEICEMKNNVTSIPNPRSSYLGLVFKRFYEKNCGYFGELKSRALFSQVPHREVPKQLLSGESKFGIMWKSEAVYWKFKYIEINKTPEKYSVVLRNDAGSGAKYIYEQFISGIFDDYYKKYSYNILEH